MRKVESLIYHFIFSLVLLSACEGNLRKNAAASLSGKSETRTFQRCVRETCATVSITYPYIGSEKPPAIQQTVDEQVLRYIQFGELKMYEDLDSAVADFLKTYEEFMESFSDASQEWEVDVTGEKVFESERMLTLKFSNFSYTGGAHPNSTVAYLNFDLEKEGKVLTEEELLVDREKMLLLAEDKFREFHAVPDGMNLAEDDRFFLQNGRFFLPHAMGFENDEWVLVYNPYEIGPYVLGYTVLRFDLEEIKGVVVSPY